MSKHLISILSADMSYVMLSQAKFNMMNLNKKFFFPLYQTQQRMWFSNFHRYYKRQLSDRRFSFQNSSGGLFLFTAETITNLSGNQNFPFKKFTEKAICVQLDVEITNVNQMQAKEKLFRKFPFWKICSKQILCIEFIMLYKVSYKSSTKKNFPKISH